MAVDLGRREIDELLDDLNTPEALAGITPELAQLLGLLQKDPEDWFKGGVDTERFDQLVEDYDAARADAIAAKKAGDKARMGELFQKSDAIRTELSEAGIIIETGPDGSTWRRE